MMNVKSNSGARAKNKTLRAIKNDFKINRSLYFLAIPVLIYFMIFKYVPMYGALIAFKDYTPKLGVLRSEWVGFDHFLAFFRSSSFWELLRNTLNISVTNLIFGFPMPILLALAMNEVSNKYFLKTVQNITYLPHFISLVVICGLIKDFTMSDGIIGQLFGGITLLNYPKYFVPVYVVSAIWQTVGWGSIIYLSALTSIDGSLYEAAMIDGAGRLKQTWHITLPGIAPTIAIMFVLRMGQMLSVGFEKIILLYNDANMSVADVISSYVYRRGLINLDFGYSTAVGLFNSLVNILLLITANFVNKKMSDSSLW